MDAFLRGGVPLHFRLLTGGLGLGNVVGDSGGRRDRQQNACDEGGTQELDQGVYSQRLFYAAEIIIDIDAVSAAHTGRRSPHITSFRRFSVDRKNRRVIQRVCQDSTAEIDKYGGWDRGGCRIGLG